jgi:hypothetical protein
MGLWLVLRQLRVTWWAAGVGAAFFAIVPSNAATAIYIAERTDAMVAAAVLFGLTCLWKYAKTRQPSQIVALNVAYALALLTKEIAVAMLPFAAVLWLFLNVEKTEPVSALVRGNLSSGLQHWGGELRIAWRAVFDPRARRDWIIVLAPLFICSLLYLVYRAEVMPPGSFRDRFGEGLNPVRALLAAMRGTFKGTPWEINNYTETPLVVAFAIGFVALPQARAWRTVLLGVGCMAAGVLPLCFNGGVEPRLLYVAEIGMAIAIAGLATVYGEALAATRHPATRVALATAFGVISLVTLAVVGSAQAAAQDAFEPGRPIQLKKDLLVWLHPSSIAYVPPANMKVIESQLREAGLIDSNGHPTVAAAGISNAGISKHR